MYAYMYMCYFFEKKLHVNVCLHVHLLFLIEDTTCKCTVTYTFAAIYRKHHMSSRTCSFAVLYKRQYMYGYFTSKHFNSIKWYTFILYYCDINWCILKCYLNLMI